jgi:hypothetical protein
MWHENDILFASIIKSIIGIIPDQKTEEFRVDVTLYQSIQNQLS